MNCYGDMIYRNDITIIKICFYLFMATATGCMLWLVLTNFRFNYDHLQNTDTTSKHQTGTVLGMKKI